LRRRTANRLIDRRNVDIRAGDDPFDLAVARAEHFVRRLDSLLHGHPIGIVGEADHRDLRFDMAVIGDRLRTIGERVRRVRGAACGDRPDRRKGQSPHIGWTPGAHGQTSALSSSFGSAVGPESRNPAE
jgi:hypothetical protein